jgi:hypothetical protein
MTAALPAALPATLAADPVPGETCLAPWWWRSMLAAGVPRGAAARFAAHGRAVLPLVEAPGRPPQSLTGPYSVVFQPLLPAGAGADDWREAGAGLARMLRPLLLLEAVDAEAAWLPPFLAGARAAGLRAARFDHFGNWHEPAGGRGWAAYLADRPGKLRETIRRKARKAGFSLVTGSGALEPAIAAYEDVYARSWKVAEPFPDFNATLMREAAAAGALRLGLLHAGEAVVAAQIWTVAGGTASVLKLAHDEAHKALSPGTVLTARMIAHLFDEEGIAALDFGRGDDPYKQLWTTRRRQRIGLFLASPRHPAGAATLLRQALGRLRRRWKAG